MIKLFSINSIWNKDKNIIIILLATLMSYIVIKITPITFEV